jgi:hypothetical protein
MREGTSGGADCPERLMDLFTNLFTRVRNILLRPDEEWRAIDRESGDPIYLFTRYVAILALIPALAGIIGGSVIGVSVEAGTFRVPLVIALLNAAISYLFTFVIVYGVALIIDGLAPSFGSERHFPSAMKLSAYSFTPTWLAGVFLLLPGLRFLSILGFYAVFLLWRGLGPLMRVPKDKTLLYTAAVVVSALLVTFALAMIQGVIADLPRAI